MFTVGLIFKKVGQSTDYSVYPM